MSPVAKNVINSSPEREDLQQQVLSRIYTGFPFHRFGRLDNSKYEPCGVQRYYNYISRLTSPLSFYQEQKIKDFFKLAHYEQADEKEKSLPSVPSYLSDKNRMTHQKEEECLFSQKRLNIKTINFQSF